MTDLLTGKVPPHSLEAEQSALGAMLVDRNAIGKITEWVEGQDFYRRHHEEIFEAVRYLYERNEPVDLVTATEALRSRGKLEEIGGVDYLASLIDLLPTAANAEFYARIVEEKAVQRKLIQAGNEIAGMVYRNDRPLDELLDQAEKLIFSIAKGRFTSEFVHVNEILKVTFERIEQAYSRKAHVTGVPTGFSDIDKLTAGLQRSDLVVIAARPSMGKTSFCLNIAAHVGTKEKLPVAIFSLETGKEQLIQRMLCAEALVDAQKLRTGYLSDEDWRKLTRAIGILAEAPIYVDDTPGISVTEMRSKSRRLMQEKGLALIFVDYLQLIRGSGRSENRVQEISEISRGLKYLAKELEVPVVAVSQLSREVEKRHPKRPQLSDLRESGAIEQDADLVAFIFREEVYQPDTEKKSIAEIIVAKQRNGPIDTIELVFLKECTKFTDRYKQA